MATPVPAEVPSEPVVDLTDQLPGDAYDAEPVATVQPKLSFSEEDLKGAEALIPSLIHLFQKSFEGEALKWNSSLPLDALHCFDNVIDRFTSQYKYQVEHPPNLCDLVN